VPTLDSKRETTPVDRPKTATFAIKHRRAMCHDSMSKTWCIMPDINDRLKAIAEKQKRISANRMEIEVRNEQIETQIQKLRPITSLTENAEIISVQDNADTQES
jgi:hypothetical protein